jgi:hypothetical protein
MEWKCSSELGEVGRVGRMKHTALSMKNGAVAGMGVWELSGSCEKNI